MARMHSRRRGSSGSTKPVNPNTDWVIYDADEVEELVQKLDDEGHSPAEIGIILRDQYGVPSVKAVADKSVTEIIAEEEAFPADMRDLMRKAIGLAEHVDNNPEDLSAKRQLSLTEAKVRRLVKYYQGSKIPADWTYNIEKARLVVE